MVGIHQMSVKLNKSLDCRRKSIWEILVKIHCCYMTVQKQLENEKPRWTERNGGLLRWTIKFIISPAFVWFHLCPWTSSARAHWYELSQSQNIRLLPIMAAAKMTKVVWQDHGITAFWFPSPPTPTHQASPSMRASIRDIAWRCPPG